MNDIALAILCLAVTGSSSIARDVERLSARSLDYRIAAEKVLFSPTEHLVLTCTIKNVGGRRVTVKDPSGSALVTTFCVDRVLDNGRKDQISRLGYGAGPPIWTAASVSLEPGEEHSSSWAMSDIMGSADYFMEPGRYVITSRYHLADAREQQEAWLSTIHSEKLEDSGFVDLAVKSNELEIVVREFSDLEKRQWEDYNEALRPLRSIGEAGGGVPRDRDMTLHAAVASLEEYVENNPDSVAIRNAMFTLKEIYSWNARQLDHVRVSRKLRRLGLSDGKRDRQILVEAGILVDLGDLAKAVEVLGETDSVFAQRWQEEIFLKHPDLRPRAEPEVPFEANKEDAPKHSDQFLTLWIWAAGILAAVVVAVVIVWVVKKKS